MISLDSFLHQLVETSLRTSVVIVMFLLLRPLLRRLIGSQWTCVLWLLILVRLLVPCSIESPWSVGRLPWFSEESSVGRFLAEEKPVMAAESQALQVRVTQSEATTVSAPAGSVGTGADLPADPLSILWATVALTGLFGFAVRVIQTRRLAAQTFPATAPHLLAAFRAIDHRLRGNVELRMSDAVNVPTLAGVWRPQIWIPVVWVEQLSSEEMHHVLLHELGHAHRGDMLVEWLFTLVQCLHWFNPLIWFAGHMAKADREMACDAWVLAHLGEEKSSDYGMTLLRIVNLLRRPMRVSPVLIEMATSKRELSTRVDAIGGFRLISTWRGGMVVLAAFIGFAMLTTTARSVSEKGGGSEPPNPVVESTTVFPRTIPAKGESAARSGVPSQPPEVRVELVVSRLEAPLAAWMELKDHELGSAIMRMDEVLKSEQRPLDPHLGVVAVLDPDERNTKQPIWSKVPGLVGTRSKPVIAKSGHASTVSFSKKTGHSSSLSIKPFVSAGGRTVDLELVVDGGNRKVSTQVSILSGHTLLLRSYDSDPSIKDANAGDATVGQLHFVTANVVDKVEAQGARKPHIEISSVFMEIPADVLKDTNTNLFAETAPGREGNGLPRVLAKAQADKLLRDLSRRKEVDIISTPRVTTRTEQRAVIEIIREFRDPEAWVRDPEKPDAWKIESYEVYNVGVVLEVEPNLNVGGSIDLQLKPQVVEPVGFVDLETGKPAPGHRPLTHAPFAERIRNFTQLSHYEFVPGHRNNAIVSMRSAEENIALQPGESVLLALKETASLRPFEDEVPKRQVLVLVTAKIIDSDHQ